MDKDEFLFKIHRLLKEALELIERDGQGVEGLEEIFTQIEATDQKVTELWEAEIAERRQRAAKKNKVAGKA